MEPSLNGEWKFMDTNSFIKKFLKTRTLILLGAFVLFFGFVVYMADFSTDETASLPINNSRGEPIRPILDEDQLLKDGDLTTLPFHNSDNELLIPVLVESQPSAIATILTNSYAVLDRQNEYQETETIKAVGIFKYEEVAGQLNEMHAANILNKLSGSNPMQTVDQTVLKVAMLEGLNRKYFTDGSILITLNNTADAENFALDYNLQFIQKFSQSIHFKPSSLDDINERVRDMAKDERVQNVELNLMDPYIKTD